ncbi:14067_t:CDS:2 [Acaulospora colombiana]|uniref:14067_t:CDS:1 n=1 Tax=Acaulospora colombiana TaxID=27376 RepID=A0ACA9LA88_9GLOM|nr:14067_t:CDS:2 [Acaulospora colombiana]
MKPSLGEKDFQNGLFELNELPTLYVSEDLLWINSSDRLPDYAYVTGSS